MVCYLNLIIGYNFKIQPINFKNIGKLNFYYCILINITNNILVVTP